MGIPMHWILLMTAGLFEVGFTTALKASEGFTKLTPTLLFIGAAAASFALLNVSMKHISLGTAYAVFTGIGTVGTAAVGILVYKEPSGAARLGFLAIIVVGIIGLKLVSKS